MYEFIIYVFVLPDSWFSDTSVFRYFQYLYALETEVLYCIFGCRRETWRDPSYRLWSELKH